MAWKTAGEIVTAADMNSTGPGVATTDGRRLVTAGVNLIVERAVTQDAVLTDEGTASTSFTDLATVGPAVTVTTGSKAIVHISADLRNDTSNAYTLAGVAVSGASTVAASDSIALSARTTDTGDIFQMTYTAMFEGLTPGSHTFTMEYRVTAGTGTFNDRRLIVDPL